MVCGSIWQFEDFSPAWYMAPSLNYSPLSYYSYYFTTMWRPYLYDLTVFKRTLERYIDFSKLNDKNVPGLIITSTDIRNSKAVLFDSSTTDIDPDHLIACASYPFYGIGWIEKDGKFLWDGALLSNTPLREVIDASP